MSAKCGAADVMEALGVNIQLPPTLLGECLEKIGIAFLFAPAIHSAAKHVQNARRETRLRTVFNLLGPLTNPAGASAQVVGVYSLELVEKLAEALSILGTHRAFVVHGLDGLDEITITSATRVGEVREGSVHTYEITPEEFGMSRAPLEEIVGGSDAAENAAIVRTVLSGEKSAKRDVVLMNSAAAIVAAGKSSHLPEAAGIAAKSIDSGAAIKKLEALVQFTQSRLKL
jgi:anthranilate phosphoribosyltransferase